MNETSKLAKVHYFVMCLLLIAFVFLLIAGGWSNKVFSGFCMAIVIADGLYLALTVNEFRVDYLLKKHYLANLETLLPIQVELKSGWNTKPVRYFYENEWRPSSNFKTRSFGAFNVFEVQGNDLLLIHLLGKNKWYTCETQK